jgi:hypothetical protein
VVERTYAAACTTRPAPLRAGVDRYALPRVDAHYLRRPELLRLALRGQLGAYLWLRRVGARARRRVVRDFVPVAR